MDYPVQAGEREKYDSTSQMALARFQDLSKSSLAPYPCKYVYHQDPLVRLCVRVMEQTQCVHEKQRLQSYEQTCFW